MPASSPDPVILVAGEALFDLVLADSAELAAHPGGGPFNAARTVARLEQPTAYLGRLSRDRFGSRLRSLLAEDGVRLDTVVDTDDPTTLALAEIDEHGAATYRFYARGTSAFGLTAEAALAALPPAVGMLHAGTSLALEPVASALEAVAAHVAGEALVMLDPNCRPTVIEDLDAYRARIWRVLASTDVVKVSEEDLALLDPGAAPVEAARRLLEPGAAAALLTLGAEGAIVITRDDEVSVAAPRVEVVDTIGAGDAFGGGFLAFWRREGYGRERLANLEALVAATEFACLVAGRTCERPGAWPPRLDEL
jgi:fructokinase